MSDSDWDDNDGPSVPKKQTGMGSNQQSSGFAFGNSKSEDNSNSFGFGNSGNSDSFKDDNKDAFGGWGFGSSDRGNDDNRGGGRGRGRGGRGRGRGCFKCSQEGHRASECPNEDSSGGGFKSSDSFNNDSGGWGFGSSDQGGDGSRGGGRGRGRGGRGRGRGCFKCSQEGHRASDCPNEGSSSGGFGGSSSGGFGGFGGDSSESKGRGCFKCSEEGHRAFECPNADKDGFGGDKPKGRGCFKCSEEGHRAAECPNADKDGFGGDKPKGRGCFKCGQEGHLSRDCTEPGDSKDGGEGPDGKPRAPLYIPPDVTDEDLLCEGISAGINFDNFANIPINISGDGVIPKKIGSFEEMNLRKILLDNIAAAKYVKPTPVQSAAVPILIGGRDIMACAQTGSGKTVAYLLPILQHILQSEVNSHAHEECAKPAALILCPTRELGIQIYHEARKVAKGSTVMTRILYGGTAVYHQLKQIQSGCHILVGTIGRIVDIMTRGKLSLEEVKFFVLDEADRMLSMGFLPDLKKILEHPSLPSCDQRQTCMFSATFPNEVQTLASSYMKSYVFVVVGSVGAANADVSQEIIEVEKFDKKNILVQYIKDVREVDANIKVLVFCETKKITDFIGSYLTNNDIKATTIHGDRFQSQREEALTTFRTGAFPVLVATSVAGRGLDIKGVGCVINFDLPKEVDEYVHRIGRTGRVGNCGHAISFYDKSTDAHLAKDLLRIMSEANQTVPDWLKAEAESSSHGPGYFGTGKFASVDVRKNVSTQQEEGAWGGNSLGGPAPPQPDGDEDWD